MSTLSWSESLNGPKSLLTCEDIAVAALEDPGIIDIRFSEQDAATRDALAAILGNDLTHDVGQSAALADKGQVLRIKRDRWLLILDRQTAPGFAEWLAQELREQPLSLRETTGAYSAIRLAGKASSEVLAKLCALDLRRIKPGQMSEAAIAQVPCLLLREEDSAISWLLLPPRSYTYLLAQELVKAAKNMPRVNLFGSASSPPV